LFLKGTYKNPHLADSSNYAIFEGWKRYELTNHLGNVLAVVSDRKIGKSTGTYPGPALWYEADVLSTQQYYPFGMLMPGRQYTVGSYDYRYGFNGKEGDDEVKGDDNQQDYGMRIYDPRVGRFLSVDPLSAQYPWYTPYQFAGNMPIWAVDLDGLEEIKYQDIFNSGFPNIIKSYAEKTSFYKEFESTIKQKSNTKLDVYFFTFDAETDMYKSLEVYENAEIFGNGTRGITLLANRESFDKVKNDDVYSQINESDIKKTLDDGRFVLFVGIAKQFFDPIKYAAKNEDKSNPNRTDIFWNTVKLQATVTMLHEVWGHGKIDAQTLIDNDFSSLSVRDVDIDHENLSGIKAYTTPSTLDIIHRPRFKNYPLYNMANEVSKMLGVKLKDFPDSKK